MEYYDADQDMHNKQKPVSYGVRSWSGKAWNEATPDPRERPGKRTPACPVSPPPAVLGRGFRSADAWAGGGAPSSSRSHSDPESWSEAGVVFGREETRDGATGHRFKVNEPFPTRVLWILIS